MARSITDIPAPDEAPGPTDDIIAELYKGRLVIYSVDDAGFESRIEIDAESDWALKNVQHAR